MKPLLAYWDIRGWANPIRLLLEYANIEYDEKRYSCGPPPTYDRQEWLDDKPNLGLDFPNLPYYIDDNIKLTQSSVILHYLAEQNNLMPKTKDVALRVDLLEKQIVDMYYESAMTFYSIHFETAKSQLIENMPAKLKNLANFLGERTYFAGDYITYVDFMAFEFISTLHAFKAELIENEPKLVAFKQRIAKLPSIEKYLNSEKCIKYPFIGYSAYWGGQYSDILNKQKQQQD